MFLRATNPTHVNHLLSTGLGEHNHWVKYTNWETDARIPTMIHVPGAGFPRGVKSSALVEHVDL